MARPELSVHSARHDEVVDADAAAADGDAGSADAGGGGGDDDGGGGGKSDFLQHT